MSGTGPLFIVVEPSEAGADQPARRVSWAGPGTAGAVDAAEARVALEDPIARASGAVFVGDHLFDPPRLAALGVPQTDGLRDWLLALAPFGQARNLAAILDAAEARADPLIPATRLLEAWREAKRRAD